MKERRYDIDWLRVIAMLTVFVFHCSRFFCTEDWHLKVPASEQSDILKIVRDMLVGVWNMELFFLVAGFATWYSLRSRTGGQYLVERVKRLLVPLYTVGLFILVVPQKYFDGVTHGYITGTFWQWLPSYYLTLPGSVLSSWRPDLDPASLLPFPFSGHLWFIQTLFVISLVTLPALLFLRSERGGRFIERLAGWVARPGGIFLFLIPLAVVQIALRWPPKLTGRTWADFLWYALFFVIGYIIAADGRFTEAIKRYGWLCLALWISAFVVVGGALTFVFHYDTSPGHGFSALYVIYVITWSIVSWSAVAFMLSLGAKYLTFGNRLLTYSNEAVLPFYLFHQTIILIVGWFVIPLEIGNLARFLLIALISFPVILVLYEVFVRRIGFMRFLFGMTPKKKQLT
jgi:surface polysaccharide O-acyltransferase-like enzyme